MPQFIVENTSEPTTIRTVVQAENHAHAVELTDPARAHGELKVSMHEGPDQIFPTNVVAIPVAKETALEVPDPDSEPELDVTDFGKVEGDA